MATVKVLHSGGRNYIVNITGAFSAADETDVVVVDRSTLLTANGNTPNKIRVNEITWAVGVGFDYVLLEWDDGTDEAIEYLQGQGYMDYSMFGGKSPAADPGSATEGDIILTTSGGATGDTYSILLHCILKD